MRKIGASIFLSVALTTALAQTNAPAGRPMSLPDCIAAALQNNFAIRIERFDPQIAQLNVNAAYAGYDPQLSVSGVHSYDNTGAYFNSAGQFIVPTESRANSFSSGLSGQTPWGMAYNFSANVGQQHLTKSLFGTNLLGDSSSGSVGVSVTQPLLKNFWIDANRLQILVSKNQLKISEQSLRNQVISTVTAVENAYYELIYAIENVKVQRDALELAQTQLEQDKQRVQVGSLAPLDVQQDEAQVAQSRAGLILAESTYGTDLRVLNNLITDSYAQTYALPIQPTMSLEAPVMLFDLQDSWTKGMSGRPDLIQARLSLEQQGIQLKYLRNQLWPEIDFIGSYGFNGSGGEYNDSMQQMNDGSRPFYSYGGQLVIPLSSTRTRNQLKAGKANEKALLLRVKELEQSIMVQIDNAVGVARSDYQSVEATRQARIYAEAALEAEQKKYAVGKSTTFTVLQLQNKLTTARSQEIRALADYNKALATLAAAEASTLARRKIDFLAR